MVLPHRVLFICSNKDITGTKFQSYNSLNKGEQAPLIRAWDEYSKRGFNIVMRLRHFLIHLHRCPPLMFHSVLAVSSSVSKR